MGLSEVKDFTLRPDHATWRRLVEYLRRIEDEKGSAPTKNSVIIDAINKFLDVQQQNPGVSPVGDNGTKLLQLAGLEHSTFLDKSAGLSSLEKVYITRCLGLLRSVVSKSFQILVDSMCGPLGLLDERPSGGPDIKPRGNADSIEKRFERGEALAEDAIRQARKELRGTGSPAHRTADRDRKGRKKPA